MAGGPIFPSSVYVGGASGSLSPTFYVPATNTNGAGQIEGIGVVSSLASSTTPYPCVLQFNMPESIPGGVLKLRTLFLTTSTSTAGVVKLTPSDGVTSPNSNIGATTLTADSQITFTSTGSDNLYENKSALASAPTANQILTVLASFNSTSAWTLSSPGVFQFSVVWE